MIFSTLPKKLGRIALWPKHDIGFSIYCPKFNAFCPRLVVGMHWVAWSVPHRQGFALTLRFVWWPLPSSFSIMDCMIEAVYKRSRKHTISDSRKKSNAESHTVVVEEHLSWEVQNLLWGYLFVTPSVASLLLCRVVWWHSNARESVCISSKVKLRRKLSKCMNLKIYLWQGM